MKVGIAEKPSMLRTALKTITNPSGVINKQLERFDWRVTLAIPASAFALLFFQTGLDLNDGEIGLIPILLSAIGIIYGAFGVGALAWLCALTLRQKSVELSNRESVVVAFCLGYTATLVYQLVGLIIALMLQWNTSVAFGVSGMLVALRPMMAVIRKTSNSVVVSVILSTICGMVLIFGWAVIGLIGG